MASGETIERRRRAKLSAVLPHEWIFGTFLLLTALRLGFAGNVAQPWSCVFFACLLAAIGAFYWTERNPTPWRWRVRLLLYPAIMGISFYAMGTAVPLLGNDKVDGLLLGWDRALVGETPALAWQYWLHPGLADLAMAGYLFFFFYLVVGPAVYCVTDLRLFRKCIVGLFTMYGLAFTGYTLLPAGGPWRWMDFATPLEGAFLLDWTLPTVNAGSNAIDVFPSVHVAATLYLLLFDWQHGRRRFWLYLLPCLVLWWSTMYLRFHYFVDLLGGIAVALAGWTMAMQYDVASRTEHGQWLEEGTLLRRLVPRLDRAGTLLSVALVAVLVAAVLLQLILSGTVLQAKEEARRNSGNRSEPAPSELSED
ncbi:phosphatase PAP2 family protein [Methyloceanibacter sp.]|uniref:phosphatase PAP2 family protein n=1 Tax=Methyloceanibacter sp. TaxID=1965321 RepID=UPI002D2C135C|nr:phosphatase PAP2 family protein [Methyloceanibacter sp.]HZP07776.1 phosphatase PAP2 family protein [Methyloceanibacter sp.]